MAATWDPFRSALRLSAVGLACALLGCAANKPAKSVGQTTQIELADADDSPAASSQEKLPADIVLRARRGWSGYRASDGRAFEQESLLSSLASADALCVGERHDSAVDHFAQLSVIEGLLERRSMRGFQLGIGLEMVRARFAPELSGYQRDFFSLEELAQRVEWETEWGYPIEYYAPQLEAAQVFGAELLSLGVAKETTKAIAAQGLAQLHPSLRDRLPKLYLHNRTHRGLFEELMAGHPLGADKLEHEKTLQRYYEAQVVWDESMARDGAAFLMAHRPGRKLVILAGIAHCHRSAIPQRLERRTGLRVVSVLPVEGGEAIARGKQDTVDELIAQGYDYQMVFER